jgi:hypothetical protein
MTRKEIIEKLKKNTEGFAFLAPEVQKFIKESPSSLLLYFDPAPECDGYGNWMTPRGADFWGDDIYRLSPDYSEPEEPKVVKCEVKITDRMNQLRRLMFVYKGVNCCPEEALSIPTFSHYEKDDGNKVGIENITTNIREGKKVFVVFIEE